MSKSIDEIEVGRAAIANATGMKACITDPCPTTRDNCYCRYLSRAVVEALSKKEP